jgi:Rieske Fe-S protein
MQSGGNVALQANGYSDPNCGQSDIIVFQSAPGQFVALSAGCNHQCCAAQFNGSNILCHCHHATWDLTGTLTHGPATANLANLPVCADANGVYVTLV